MIEFLLGSRSSQGSIRAERSRISFADVGVMARRMAGTLARDHGIGPASNLYLRASDSARLIAALGAAELLGATACVLNRAMPQQEAAELSRRLPPGLTVTDDGSGIPLDCLDAGGELRTASAVPGRVMILTTGTTGTPKPVLYHWERLASQVREAREASVWALLYPLNHFAGIQVLVHALKTGSVLAIPKSRGFPDVQACMVEHSVDSASATPTFWRTFAGRLDAPEAARLRLRQITLGGEPVTAEILERLRELFPAARITHVYATTELGSCFAVNDGLAGFPAKYLEAPVGNVELKVRDGELFVRTAHGMECYGDGSRDLRNIEDWTATGDCVEILGDRVYFLGRVSEIVNVGGIKVSPPRVEQEIRRVSGVRDVRVFGKPNPVTGQIVAAELEIADERDCDGVLAEVRAACRARLSRYEQPRDIRVVAGLPRRNEKLARTPA
jgi:acyl-CoA synthetase (AMP-forming)/AMP-acid ligase II